jgi:hypothetical protein
VYAVATSLVVFFVAWAVISARPFVATAAKDDRIAALEQREKHLRHESLRVKRVVERRFAVYRVRLRHRERAIARIRAANARDARSAAALSAASVAVAPTPSVSVVSIPAVTSTRSS